jgi:hypothetical protein
MASESVGMFIIDLRWHTTRGSRVSNSEPLLVVCAFLVGQWDCVQGRSQPLEPYHDECAYRLGLKIGNKTLDGSDTTCSLFCLRAFTTDKNPDHFSLTSTLEDVTEDEELD